MSLREKLLLGLAGVFLALRFAVIPYFEWLGEAREATSRARAQQLRLDRFLGREAELKAAGAAAEGAFGALADQTLAYGPSSALRFRQELESALKARQLQLLSLDLNADESDENIDLVAKLSFNGVTDNIFLFMAELESRRPLVTVQDYAYRVARAKSARNRFGQVELTLLWRDFRIREGGQ